MKGYYGKRLFDVIFSLFSLILLSPFLFIIALLILVSSSWPIFYCHQRIRFNGKIFKMIKFRTMIRHADEEQDKEKKNHQIEKPFFNIEDDPRLTWIGKFLKKLTLDELPQFINVLIGQMSVVGPRPIPLPRDSSDGYTLRFDYLGIPNLKSGITGPYQIKRKGEDINEWNLIDSDEVDIKYYAGNQTMYKDLAYIVRTAYLVISKVCQVIIKTNRSDKSQIIVSKTVLRNY